MQRPYLHVGNDGPVEHHPAPYFSCSGCIHYGSKMKLRGHRKSEDYHYCCHSKFGENPEMVASGGIPYTPNWCPIKIDEKQTPISAEIKDNI